MNGVLKTQAQYYNDTTIYTGEGGTATNKAVIEDIYDLLAWVDIMTNQAETFAITQHKQYAVMVADVDFNNHPTMKFGITTSFLDMYFNGNYGDLDGQEHIIRNAVFNGNSPAVTTGIISRGTLNNVNFKNMVVIDARADTKPVIDNITLNRCNFSVYMNTTGFGSVFGKTTSTYNDSTFNIMGAITESSIFSHGQLISNRCLYNFSNLNILSTTTVKFCSNTGTIFNNCGFTGLISQSGNTTSVTFIIGRYSNCYFALKCTALDNYVGTGSGAYTNIFNTSSSSFVPTGIIAFNKDTWNSNGTYTDTSNVKYITDTNMKSKSFMQGLGFVTL